MPDLMPHLAAHFVTGHVRREQRLCGCVAKSRDKRAGPIRRPSRVPAGRGDIEPHVTLIQNVSFKRTANNKQLMIASVQKTTFATKVHHEVKRVRCPSQSRLENCPQVSVRTA